MGQAQALILPDFLTSSSTLTKSSGPNFVLSRVSMAPLLALLLRLVGGLGGGSSSKKQQHMHLRHSMLTILLHKGHIFQIMQTGTSQKDLKSRQVLSQLLDEQLSRNEELSEDNLKLEAEQRQLLALLTHKMNELEQMRQKASAKPMANDSTLEMTQLGNDQEVRRNRERVVGLEAALKQKEQAMESLRQYYSQAIEQMEANHANNEEEESQKQKEVETALKKTIQQKQKENDSLHEVNLRNNEKIRQLTQEVVMLNQNIEDLTQQTTVLNKIATERKQQLAAVQQIQQRVRKEHQKEVQEWEEKVHQLRMATSEESGLLEKKHKEAIRELETKYEEQIKLIVVQGEQQKNALKQQYAQEAKAVIMSQLEHQENQTKEQMNQLKAQLQKVKEELEQSHNSSKRHKQHVKQLQDRVKEFKTNQENKQQQSNELNDQLEEKMTEIRKLDVKCKEQKKKRNEAEDELGQLKQELSEQLEKHQRTSKQLQRIELQYKRIDNQHQQVKSDLKQAQIEYQSAKEQVSSANIELQLKTDQVARLQARMTKETQRRDKLMAQNRRVIKEQEEEIEEWRGKVGKIETEHEEKLAAWAEKVRETRENLNTVIEQKNKVTRENKTIKENVVGLQDRVKQNFGLQHQQIQELNDSNLQLKNSLKNSNIQRDNYRKLYEKSAMELGRTNEKLTKSDEIAEKLGLQLGNSQHELECLRQQLIEQELGAQEREQLQRLREELVAYKAKVQSMTEGSGKLKRQKDELTGDLQQLYEENCMLRSQKDKSDNRAALLSNQKDKIQAQKTDLEAQLHRRCRQLEAEGPYLNTLVEEKKQLEGDLQRLSQELKRKDHLLEVAKRSKAETMHHLAKQNEELKVIRTQQQGQLSNAKITVDQLNREKVSLMRDTATRQELMKQLQQEKKQLKAEVKKLQKTCDEQQEQIEKLYTMFERLDGNERV